MDEPNYGIWKINAVDTVEYRKGKRNYIYDCDIKGSFTIISHKQLIMANKYIADGTVLNLI